MIKVTGLWQHKNKNDEIYYTGNLGKSRIVILPNSFKKEDKDPTFNLFIAEDNKGYEKTKDATVTEGDVPQ